MTRYIVTFFKNVLSSDGHLFKAPQERIEMCADTPGQAMETAQRRFASMRQAPDWQHHADTVEIAADSVEDLRLPRHRSSKVGGITALNRTRRQPR